MKRLLRPGLLALLILITLLWVAFSPHELIHDFRQAQRAGQSTNSEDLLASAQAFARLAGRLPWRTDLWEQAGSYALQGGDPASAIRYLLKAETVHNLSLAGWVALGDAYQQVGDQNDALQAWEKAVRNGQAAPPVYEHLYQAHLEAGDYTAAARALQELANQQPLDAGFSYQLGLLLAALEPESALVHLTRAADLDPDLRDDSQTVVNAIRTGLLGDDPAYALLSSGRALAAINEWQLASLAFQQSLTARPAYAEAWAFLGEASQHLAGSEPELNPLDLLGKALALDPSSLSANSLLGLYWRRQGDHELALKYYQKTAEMNPNNPILQVDLANALAYIGAYETALATFRHAIELSPQDPAYYRYLAAFSLSYEYQVRQIGLPAARQALLLDPDDPASLVTMGQVLLLLGDLATAERYLNDAVHIDPGYAPAHLQLGLIYILQDDRQAALSKWELVENLAPGTPAAEQAQRLLQNYFP